MFIQGPVASQESHRSCICVDLNSLYAFLLDFGAIPTV